MSTLDLHGEVRETDLFVDVGLIRDQLITIIIAARDTVSRLLFVGACGS